MSLDFGCGTGGSQTQYTVIPAVTIGSIIQYVGETDTDYTQGYFYKGVIDSTSATISQTAGTGLTNITVNKATWETQIDKAGDYVFSYNNGWKFNGSSVTLSDYGISYTETNTLSVSQTTGNDLGTVSANQTTWETQVSNAGTYVFTYDGTNWKLGNTNVSLSTYGISYTATSTQDSATGSQTSGSGITNIAVNVSTFKSAVSAISGSPITTGNYVFTYNGTNWKYGQYDVSMPSLGITFTEPQAYIEAYSEPVVGDSITAWLEDEQLWKSMVSQSGTYEFVYSESDGGFLFNGVITEPYDYGIGYSIGYAEYPTTSLVQTVGNLTIVIDDNMFGMAFSDNTGDYTFTFDGDYWEVVEQGMQGISTDALQGYGVYIEAGTPQAGDTFVVSLVGGTYGPTDGDKIIVNYTTALQSGDAITVAYTQGITVPATGDAITAVYVRGVDNGDELTVDYEITCVWQQINVQP